MADTPKTRISIDVWEQAGQVAERMGLNSERAAIEAVFRCFHDAYVLGDVPVSADEGRGNPDFIRITATPAEPDKEPNCAADLNNLLNA